VVGELIMLATPTVFPNIPKLIAIAMYIIAVALLLFMGVHYLYKRIFKNKVVNHVNEYFENKKSIKEVVSKWFSVADQHYRINGRKSVIDDQVQNMEKDFDSVLGMEYLCVDENKKLRVSVKNAKVNLACILYNDITITREERGIFFNNICEAKNKIFKVLT